MLHYAETGSDRSFTTDTFIARSAFQKAIRRGDTGIALQAARSLWASDYRVIWRRLIVTALEDLGVNEMGFLIEIASTMTFKRGQPPAMADWDTIQLVVSKVCSLTRCQAANDLANLVEFSVMADEYKARLATLNAGDLLKIATCPHKDLVERHTASMTLLGSEYGLWIDSGPRIDPAELIARLGCRIDPRVAKTYGWAFRKTRLGLAHASVLLLDADPSVLSNPPVDAVDDHIPITIWIKDVPSFALDQYTRPGRAAIHSFLKESGEWQKFVAPLKLSKTTQFKAAGELLFRTEGAVVTRRRSWGVANALFRCSRLVGCYIPTDMVDAGLSLMRTQLPHLNDLRFRHYAAERLQNCN